MWVFAAVWYSLICWTGESGLYIFAYKGSLGYCGSENAGSLPSIFMILMIPMKYIGIIRFRPLKIYMFLTKIKGIQSGVERECSKIVGIICTVKPNLWTLLSNNATYLEGVC